MVLARLLEQGAWKLSASFETNSILVPPAGRAVISATAAAVCAALVPWLVLPLPGVLTRTSRRSPTLRPPGARMLFGDTSGFTTVTVASVVVVFEKVKLKLVSGKL